MAGDAAARDEARPLIAEAVVIGDNNGRSPVLGNDIFVGSGAKIIGGLSIGDRVRIGANAVVLINLPDDCTAVGVPARILPTKVNH